jgi:CRISPR-associated protein Csm5
VKTALNDGERLFDAYPISPVHVGSGDKLSLDDYTLDGDTLIRFNASAALAALRPADAQKYVSAIDQNRFQDARRLLLTTAARHIRYKVPMGPECAKELCVAMQEPDRRTGDVWALQRNPVTGEVIIPGSAVKGAIRTALLSSRLPEARAAQLKSLREREADEQLRLIAFGATNRETEKDPLRALHVSDAQIPADKVRVDRARSINRNGKENPEFQMHFERLLSYADGQRWSFRARIRISPNGTCGLRKLGVERPVAWEEITKACRTFFFARLNSDIERFPQSNSGYIQGIQNWGPGCIPLRIGRFSHFESLSVEGARQQRGRDGRVYVCGSSRTLCQIGDQETNTYLPFGWVMLSPV